MLPCIILCCVACLYKQQVGLHKLIPAGYCVHLLHSLRLHLRSIRWAETASCL